MISLFVVHIVTHKMKVEELLGSHYVSLIREGEVDKVCTSEKKSVMT